MYIVSCFPLDTCSETKYRFDDADGVHVCLTYSACLQKCGSKRSPRTRQYLEMMMSKECNRTKQRESIARLLLSIS